MELFRMDLSIINDNSLLSVDENIIKLAKYI